MPLALTDQQLDAVFFAARPLAVRDRDAYLKEVAAALANGGGPVGDGDLHRAIRTAQRKFFDPTQLSDPGMISKYR